MNNWILPHDHGNGGRAKLFYAEVTADGVKML